jgi:hypothetical protein
MRILANRPLILLPLVTAVVLVLPRTAPAAEPVVWRTDYNTARKEAAERGLPLFVVVGTDNCFYCKKLEAGPCREANVASILASSFIPLKIDASRDPNLARALKVQLYPTIVLAGPDGKIHAFVEGYIEADRLADHLKRAGNAVGLAAAPIPAPNVVASPPPSPPSAGVVAVPIAPTVPALNAPSAPAASPEWAQSDYEQANRALSSGDYPRAVMLLKNITRELGDKPLGMKAQLALDDLERVASGKLTRAKELEQQGLTQQAMDVLADAVKTYAGTQFAAEAATMLTNLSGKPELAERLRLRTAQDLLTFAREDFHAGRYFDCLQRCEQLTLYPDLREAKEGAAIAADVKGNPERLAAVCEQMNQRTAAMYLTLAESWAAKGQNSEAIACYEKVVTLSPNTRQGDLALAQLTKLKANGGGAYPLSVSKPNQ